MAKAPTNAEVIARTKAALGRSRAAAAETARAIAASKELLKRSTEMARQRAEFLSSPPRVIGPAPPNNDNVDLERLIGPIMDPMKHDP